MRKKKHGFTKRTYLIADHTAAMLEVYASEQKVDVTAVVNQILRQKMLKMGYREAGNAVLKERTKAKRLETIVLDIEEIDETSDGSTDIDFDY